MREIRAQRGPQERFLATSADIALYGGAAGGGKTWALLLEAIRHRGRRGFGATIFRRQHTQITNEGGLWDEAANLYPVAGGIPVRTPHLTYRFHGGSRVTFSHLNEAKDVYAWQGAQLAMIGFDELTHFEAEQFWYMLSRNRSTCGVRPYVRATTNPDADSWVAKLIAWWIDQETGYPIPERSGVIRWFVRIDGVVHWGDSPDVALEHGMQPSDAKSFTFIPSKITDNQAMLARDPGYVANLKALSRVEKARLLDGNWKIRPAAGLYFRRSEANVIPEAPKDVEWLRGWDLAATEEEAGKDPDWTAGVKLGRVRSTGRLVVGHVRRERMRAGDVRKLLRAIAEVDGPDTRIAIPEDPGQAGKDQAEQIVSETLAGWPVQSYRVTGDKVTRAESIATQWQHGNVDVVAGPWNEAFFDELEAFPTKGVHDDQVDGFSLAYYGLIHDFRPSEATTASIRF